ncbi:hypothetical protein ZWY2020_030288 [Hordeum vulgare]|nr:hypothetical protein ZWY2020_030288 [Hordeum vulgare]
MRVFQDMAPRRDIPSNRRRAWRMSPSRQYAARRLLRRKKPGRKPARSMWEWVSLAMRTPLPEHDFAALRASYDALHSRVESLKHNKLALTTQVPYVQLFLNLFFLPTLHPAANHARTCLLLSMATKVPRVSLWMFRLIPPPERRPAVQSLAPPPPRRSRRPLEPVPRTSEAPAPSRRAARRQLHRASPPIGSGERAVCCRDASSPRKT